MFLLRLYPKFQAELCGTSHGGLLPSYFDIWLCIHVSRPFRQDLPALTSTPTKYSSALDSFHLKFDRQTDDPSVPRRRPQVRARPVQRRTRDDPRTARSVVPKVGAAHRGLRSATKVGGIKKFFSIITFHQ